MYIFLGFFWCHFGDVLNQCKARRGGISEGLWVVVCKGGRCELLRKDSILFFTAFSPFFLCLI